jgi:hypothetical protein
MTTAHESQSRPPQGTAKAIWDNLDAEEAGSKALPADDAPADPAPAPDTTAAAPAPAPADHRNDGADASQGDAGAADGDRSLSDKIAGLEAMLGQVTQRLRNAEGHIGGLGSQLKQQQQLAQQVAARGGDAPSAGEIRAAQGSAQAMEALVRDYPEFGSAVQAALAEQVQAIKALQIQTPQQQTGVSLDDIARLRSEMAVEVRHPGWQDRVKTTEFVGWLNRQQREVQMLAASDSPQDAVRLLDLHSDTTNSMTTQRNQRLSSAAAIPSGRAGGNARAKPVEDMTAKEYWAYLDELDKAKA